MHASNIFYEFDNRSTKGFDYNTLPKSSINTETFPISFFSIVALFGEDCHYNIGTLYGWRSRLYISGEYSEDNNTFMLRYGGTDNRLIVARVKFISRRQGKMTELYKILKHIQKIYKTGPIVIESVTSDEMVNWCIKNGFNINSFNDYIECI